MYSEPVPRHRLLVLAAIAALCWLASALTVAHQAADPTDAAGLRLSVFGISRDAKHYVHTYARLLSDLYVVDGLK